MKIDEIFREIGKSNIIDILRCASACSVRRTRVVREFNINQALFQKRINFLIENGYVIRSTKGGRNVWYKASEKGESLLEIVGDLEKLHNGV